MWERRRRGRGLPGTSSGRVVAVTGAAGRVGTACLDLLAARGHEVVAIDRRRGAGPGHWRNADLRDARAARDAVAGATHLVHLAGWTAPDPSAPTRVLLENVAIAANVLDGFAAGPAQTAVVASSSSVYGLVWAGTERTPEYLPVDEEHPCCPDDDYSLSKLVLEQLAAMWTRRTGMTTVALRFPWTSGHEPDRIRDFIGTLADDPTGETARRHLWSYVHLDDLADAIVRALDVDDGGAHVLNIASPDIPGGHRLSALAATCFPSVPRQCDVDSCGGLRTDRATRLLGWQPTRTFAPSGHDGSP